MEAIKSGTGINGDKRMNLNDFGDPLNFPPCPHKDHFVFIWEMSQQLLDELT